MNYYNASSQPVTQSPSNQMAAAAPWAALADVVKNVTNNLFKQKRENKKAELEQKLALLSNQQQAVLNEKLLQASTDTERLAILENAVTQIKIAQVTTAANKENTTALLVLASGIVVITAAIVVKKVVV